MDNYGRTAYKYLIKQLKSLQGELGSGSEFSFAKRILIKVKLAASVLSYLVSQFWVYLFFITIKSTKLWSNTIHVVVFVVCQITIDRKWLNPHFLYQVGRSSWHSRLNNLCSPWYISNWNEPHEVAVLCCISSLPKISLLNLSVLESQDYLA